MKTKPIIRTKTTRISLKEARLLFLELMGGEEAAKSCRRMYVAWHGFRAGLDLAQRGRVSANDVAMFRRHVGSEPNLEPVSRDLSAIADWLVNGATGTSSRYLLATALAGQAPQSDSDVYPRDSYDLARCFTLVEKAPWVRAVAFPVLAAASAKWRPLIGAWDELKRLYDSTPGPDSKERWHAVTGEMRRLFAAGQ